LQLFLLMSRTLLNVLLTVVLLALLAVAFYEPGKPEKPAAEKITQLDPGAIQQLRIQSPGRAPLLLKKQAGEWRMQSPFAMSANQGRIQLLLRVAQAKSIASYAMSGVDANQLQLDAPMLSLTLDDVLLRFGTTAAMGGSRYVQVGNAVHLITDRYSHLAQGAATEFVSPALLPEASVIGGLVLPNLHLTQQQGRWLAKGLVNGQTADADAVESLLNEWRHARALRVSALAQSATTQQATEEIAVSITSNADKQSLRFNLLRSETEIILQRHELGVQYHFPLDVGQRLLALPADNNKTAP
jgi:Domain of unknown function (DUF4340)